MDPLTDDLQTIALVAERATIGKRRVDWHRVVVRTETVDESEVLHPELARAEVTVTRVPVGRDIDAAPETRVEGEVTIIPVVEERLVVHRQLVLVEEIHLRQTRVSEVVPIEVSLRKQHAFVERIDADPRSSDIPRTPFEETDDD